MPWLWRAKPWPPTYNFWLKSGPNTPYVIGSTKCAAGAFSFTKTGVSSSPVSVTLPIAQNCISPGNPAQALSLTGTLNVVVRNITLNGQNQGPNVDGLTGVLTSAQFTKSCTALPLGRRAPRLPNGLSLSSRQRVPVARRDRARST